MSNLRIAHVLTVIGVSTLSAATFASAPESNRISVSGVFSMKVSEQHASPVADPSGPVLTLTQSTGSNRSTGKAEYMDGAQVVNREIADLTQGNGPHQGYLTEIKGADTSVTRWQGNVVTALGPDQKPATRFEGTWSKISGTGKYQGISGSGRYTGRMLSPTEYTVEWSGEIVTQRTAAR